MCTSRKWLGLFSTITITGVGVGVGSYLSDLARSYCEKQVSSMLNTELVIKSMNATVNGFPFHLTNIMIKATDVFGSKEVDQYIDNSGSSCSAATWTLTAFTIATLISLSVGAFYCTEKQKKRSILIPARSDDNDFTGGTYGATEAELTPSINRQLHK